MVDWYYLEKDIANCSLSNDEVERITHRLIALYEKEDEFSFYEVKELVDRIKSNQLDPITSGMNYGQKDIMRHLKKLR